MQKDAPGGSKGGGAPDIASGCVAASQRGPELRKHGSGGCYCAENCYQKTDEDTTDGEELLSAVLIC